MQNTKNELKMLNNLHNQSYQLNLEYGLRQRKLSKVFNKQFISQLPGAELSHCQELG